MAAPLHSMTEPQPTQTGPKTLTGSQIIWEALVNEGVKTVFGYPGGAIMPAYDALTDYPQLRHILVRHEQGAAHMADGFARASGKVGVCIATSGPGVTPDVAWEGPALHDFRPGDAGDRDYETRMNALQQELAQGSKPCHS